jgi:hypothetical protein
VFADFVESDEIAYIDDKNNKLCIARLDERANRECDLPEAHNVTCLKIGENSKRYLLVGYKDGRVEIYDAEYLTKLTVDIKVEGEVRDMYLAKLRVDHKDWIYTCVHYLDEE